MIRRRSGGDELLAYRQGRSWRHIASPEINEYIKEVVGADVSAKDFRTWHGTSIAAVALAGLYAESPSDKKWTATAKKQAMTQAIQQTAQRLGNTPAVCRRSYVAPRVLAGFESGRTVARAVGKAKRQLPTPTLSGDEIVSVAGHLAVERAVLKLLRS